ncbi:MAG: hypothetical protein RL757_3268 [Bacteroidota bacterium]|jgi:photosystem II stability/assembly factor-like uncharacterized protein
MKVISKIALLGGVVAIGIGAFAVNKIWQSPHDSVEESENKTEMLEAYYAQEFEKTVDPATGTVPIERLTDAKRYADELRAQNQFSRAAIGLSWAERGPSNIGGRTRALLFDLNDATYKKVWAGSVGGGLWCTNDITLAAPVWTKKNDLFGNLAVTTMAQNPVTKNTMYFGTGEGWLNSDAIRGLGVWKSTDGGTTWAQLSATNNSNFYYVQKIVVDSAGIVYAATKSGLQRSTDGGTTWTKVLGTGLTVSSANNDIADIEIAKDNSLYVTCGMFSTGQVWKSNRATYGVNTGALSNWANITPSGLACRRIELACAPNNATRLYIVCHSGTNNDCSNIYRSETSGTSWVAGTVPTIIDQGANSNFCRGQAWYDLTCSVDPLNADRVYIAGVDALRSTDKGATWSQITTWSSFGAPAAMPIVHADQHAIVFAPGSSTKAIWGTDGGIFYTATASTAPYPSYTSKNVGYNVTQYYAADINPTSGSNFLLAGAQDNGSQTLNGAGIATGTSVSGGDGCFAHINQVTPTIQTTSYVYSNFYISTNSGASFTAKSVANSGAFVNPSDLADSSNVLYHGWTAGSLSRLRSLNLGAAGTTSSSFTVTGASGIVQAIRVDPTNNSRVWAGFGGKLYRIDNANAAAPTITAINSASFPVGAYMSSIDVKRSNGSHLMVTFSNYGVNSIWTSTNGGTTWTSIEGNLPDMPIRWGIFDPKNGARALVATELGVWTTTALTGATTAWNADNTGLANVRVDMLKYRISDYTVVAATHGRGLFTAVLPGVVAPIVGGGSSSALTNGETDNNNGGIYASPNTGTNATEEALTAVVRQNPFQDELGLKFNQPPHRSMRILLVDVAGRIAVEQQLESVESEYLTIYTGGVGRGNYILRIEPKNAKPFALKVFKN